MKSIFNFRFFVVAFLSLMAGIFATVSFAENNKFLFYLALVGIIIIVVYLILTLVINKQFFKFTKLKTICVITIILGFIVGGSIAYFKINNFKPQNMEGTVFVEGRISQKHISNNGNKYLILEDVNLNNEKCEYNVVVYFDGDFNIEEGYTISFYSNLQTNKLVTLEGLNTFVCMNNVGYTAFSYSINVESDNINLLERFKILVWNKLISNMSEDNAGLSQAVLFGDKEYLHSDIKSAFQGSGVSHLLAISGLHVGIFISVLYFVLNKCKVKKHISFIVSCIFLLLFNILCNFTTSVVRASIMSLCLLFATCFGKRSDTISNLSFAGILILLINPINLFDIGFELSFLAVFGILFLNRPLQNLFTKIKIPKTLAGYLGTTISATLFTLPVVANTFGLVAVGLIIANIILIPLFTIYYISLLIGIFLSFIPSFSVLLIVPNFLCDVMISITNLIAKLGTIKIFEFGMLAFISYLILGVVISKYTILKPINRTLGICIFVIILCVSLIFEGTTTITYKNKIFVYNTVDNCSLVTGMSGNNYLMNVGDGDKSDLDNISELLNSLKIKKIKSVVISNYNAKMQTYLGDFLYEFSVENLYIPDFVEDYNLFGLNKNLKSKVNVNLINFNEATSLEDGLYFYAIYSQTNTCKFLMYNFNNNVIAQNVSRLSDNQITSLKDQVKEEKIDILLQQSILNNYENSFWLGDKICLSNKCYTKNFEKVVINNSYYVKINAVGDLSYEIY